MIKQNQPYKIALIGDCLAGGGAEKVHSILSFWFEKQGFEVHNCIFIDWISYQYAGSLVNLGKILPNATPPIRKAKRFSALKKFIRDNDFDFVIDFRMRQQFVLEILLSKFIYPKNTFYTVHSGVWEYYFPKSPLLANLIYKNRNIVTVSEAIKNRILEKKIDANVHCINNPFDLHGISYMKNESISDNTKFVLAAGSMNVDNKQFDKLIAAYAKSKLPSNGISFFILGEGENIDKYQELAEKLGVKKEVVFKGFVENPFPYYKNALFFVLSSRNEGFPNVLVEALATGTPVVSFDCFSGPNEIVKNKENGLLVEDQNFQKLASAMNEMVFDEKLYYHCKENAIPSTENFDINKIGAQWLELLKVK
ncbi:MAG: glycosyltransferase [Flavobacterium sp.]|nr:glycosyltransferase [Flavobacterium sp.]